VPGATGPGSADPGSQTVAVPAPGALPAPTSSVLCEALLVPADHGAPLQSSATVSRQGLAPSAERNGPAPGASAPTAVVGADQVPVSPPPAPAPPMPTPLAPPPPPPVAPSAPGAGVYAASSGPGSECAFGLPVAVLPAALAAPSLGAAVLVRSGVAGSVVGGADDPGCRPD
jgi:hypothetical protein